MGTTRDRLIEKAIHLVRVRGYSGFSYADLADAVSIRKPSIHHYFPAKEDLGAAIVDAYSKTFFAQLRDIAARNAPAREKISRYADLYRDALKSNEGCLCGMLASEVAILPEPVRGRVASFFTANLRWLEDVLAADGATATPRKRQRVAAAAVAQAGMILGTLQGALVVARALGDRDAFENAVAGVLAKVDPH